MTADTDQLRAAELVARTPATRNRYVDFLRVASLGVVVLNHWLVAGIWIDDGEVNGRNVLELIPVAWHAAEFEVRSLLVLVTKDHPAELSSSNEGGGSFSDRELSTASPIRASG